MMLIRPSLLVVTYLSLDLLPVRYHHLFSTNGRFPPSVRFLLDLQLDAWLSLKIV